MTCRRRIQFVSDRLVEQVAKGEKTASVARVGEIEEAEDQYNDALVVGECYDVFDDARQPRCAIRIVGMELCRWDRIPERLWRGEVNRSAEEFRADHRDYFADPSEDFEFIAYYFELLKSE